MIILVPEYFNCPIRFHTIKRVRATVRSGEFSLKEFLFELGILRCVSELDKEKNTDIIYNDSHDREEIKIRPNSFSLLKGKDAPVLQQGEEYRNLKCSRIEVEPLISALRSG